MCKVWRRILNLDMADCLRNWHLHISMGNALSTANHLTSELIENGTRSLTHPPGVSESYNVPQSALGPVVELRATP